jgi:hypothetical protein
MKFIPAKNFLKRTFTSVSDGGVIRLNEIARLLGSDKDGRVNAEQQEIITELCEVARPVQMNLLRDIPDRKKGPKHLTIILSSLGATTPENLIGVHGLHKKDDGTIRSNEAYFASRLNVITGMENYIETLAGNSALSEITNHPTQYGRVLHLGVLNTATAQNKNVIYMPMKLNSVSEQMLARIKGRGYEVEAVVIDDTLEAKQGFMAGQFDGGAYAFESRAKLLHAVEKDHKRFPDQLRKHLKYADTITVLSCDPGRSGNHKTDADNLKAGGHEGIDPKHYSEQTPAFNA